MSKISVLGSGGWGTAIAILLASNGHDVKLWSFLEEETAELCEYRENKRYLPGIEIPQEVEFLSDMKSAVCGAEYIVSAVPSKGVKNTAKQLAEYIDVENQVLVSVSKGLDADSYRRLSEIISWQISAPQLSLRRASK